MQICKKTAAAESACRQYRAVRWFLLPEAELPPRLDGHRRLITLPTEKSSSREPETCHFEPRRLSLKARNSWAPDISTITAVSTAIHTSPFTTEKIIQARKKSDDTM